MLTCSRTENALTSEMPAGDLQAPLTAGDYVQGPDAAPVTLVEYADYECPYSRIATGTQGRSSVT
jgi:protein-disulfide isomerase